VKIALEAIKGQRTINEIATHYCVHPNMAPQWKKQAILEFARCLLDPAGTRRPRGRSFAAREPLRQCGHCPGALFESSQAQTYLLPFNHFKDQLRSTVIGAFQ
jgi:hypothetical protein